MQREAGGLSSAVLLGVPHVNQGHALKEYHFS